MPRPFPAALVFLLALAWAMGSAAQDSASLTGGQFVYTVQPGDYLIKIGARFGTAPALLARQNGIAYGGILRPGRRLAIDNRHIVPETLEEGILINLPQRMLFFFHQGELAAHYPVGLGKPSWPTPEGRFRVTRLEEDKTWRVPVSIQEEMEREGKAVLTEVPPGPDNPLGRHWIGLSLAGYGIHGTIAPASIYHFQSHGCIRLHPDDIAGLFSQARRGLPGKIIYAPVLLAVLEDGRLFLEVHADVYNRGLDLFELARRQAQAAGVQDRIDWAQADAVIKGREGLAREVTLPAAAPESNP